MGRIVKDARIDTREARLKLKEREDREPHWRLIHEGLHLGYRRGANGGVWLVRIRNGSRYSKKVIGRADDFQDSDGQDVLSFREAQAIALRFTAPQYTAKDLTVKLAADRYMEWFKNNRKGYKNTLIALEAHMRVWRHGFESHFCPIGIRTGSFRCPQKGPHFCALNVFRLF